MLRLDLSIRGFLERDPKKGGTRWLQVSPNPRHGFRGKMAPSGVIILLSQFQASLFRTNAELPLGLGSKHPGPKIQEPFSLTGRSGASLLRGCPSAPRRGPWPCLRHPGLKNLQITQLQKVKGVGSAGWGWEPQPQLPLRNPGKGDRPLGDRGHKIWTHMRKPKGNKRFFALNLD